MQVLEDVCASVVRLSNVDMNASNWIMLKELLQKQSENVRRAFATLPSSSAAVEVFEQMLQVLNVQRHTLGVLYIIDQFLSSRKDIDTLPWNSPIWLSIEKLVNEGQQEHLRSAMNMFSRVIRDYTAANGRSGLHERSVPVLVKSIKHLRLSTDQFTPLHAEFALRCLQAKAYDVAPEILDVHVTAFDDHESFSALDILSYYYYGGLLYCGTEQWRKARHFFHTAVTYPAAALSAVMVEAYKRYILVCLIDCGNIESLQSDLSPTIFRQIVTLCTPYVRFAEVVEQKDIRAALAVLDNDAKFCELAKKDHLFGLVKRSVRSLSRRLIGDLTKTYLTLTLDDIAREVHLRSADEAQREVAFMIERGILRAKIVEDGGIRRVSFLEYDTSKELEIPWSSKIKGTLDSTRSVTELDRNTQCTDAFLKAVVGPNRLSMH